MRLTAAPIFLLATVLAAGCDPDDPSDDAGVDAGPPELRDAGPDAAVDASSPGDASVPTCGDEVCNGSESCESCASDCGACPAVPDWVGVSHATTKFRPTTPLPASQAASIEAARNEFEAFYVVVEGPRRVDAITVSALVGPGGASIEDAVHVYRAAFHDVRFASDASGAAGLWPDPLIPDVDAIVGERRDAFPYDVPAGERQSFWVEVLVPDDATAGRYEGTVTVETDGEDATLPVALRVFDFTLPSTASLPSTFGFTWDGGCIAHRGSYEACGDAGVEEFKRLYVAFLLDHRISADAVYFWYPDWSTFDALYAPLLDGTAPTRLAGARLTTVASPLGSGSTAEARVAHWAERGWTSMLFQYTCDEPPNGCAFSEIPSRGAPARAAGMRTLVTTSLDDASTAGVLDSIDVLVPLMNWVGEGGRFGTPADYLGWVGEAPDQRRFFWYQSCISHGCGACGEVSAFASVAPSYVIDNSALQNRAMEWITFHQEVQGELYFNVSEQLATAWDDQCMFSGTGDGTMLYPGTPARIGGTTDIPVASIRIKLVREGMEDYEYLQRLVELGDRDFAMTEARALFPRSDDVSSATPTLLYEARRRLAERIESLE